MTLAEAVELLYFLPELPASRLLESVSGSFPVVQSARTAAAALNLISEQLVELCGWLVGWFGPRSKWWFA